MRCSRFSNVLGVFVMRKLNWRIMAGFGNVDEGQKYNVLPNNVPNLP